MFIFAIELILFWYYRYNNVLVEYCRCMPYGLSVAASFLNFLHDPSEPIPNDITVEAVVKRVFEQGGQKLNDELCSLVVDIYNLYTELNLTLENL